MSWLDSIKIARRYGRGPFDKVLSVEFRCVRAIRLKVRVTGVEIAGAPPGRLVAEFCRGDLPAGAPDPFNANADMEARAVAAAKLWTRKALSGARFVGCPPEINGVNLYYLGEIDTGRLSRHFDPRPHGAGSIHAVGLIFTRP